MTTDNILHYLGIIEERTLEIISNYHRMKEMADKENECKKSPFANDLPMDLNAFIGAVEPVSVNPPRLLDYSSDEDEGEDGMDSSLRPLHRSDINYSKIASRASIGTGRANRKTMVKGRRGSQMMFHPRTSMLSTTREVV